MSASFVVVPLASAKKAQGVSLAQDDHVVEEIAADGTDGAFHVGFCHGERKAVIRSAMPMLATRFRNSCS